MNAETTSLSSATPPLGHYWEGEGGYRAGVAKDKDGREYSIVIAADKDHKVIILDRVEYGSYSTKIPGAGHFTDGLANVEALLAAESPLAKAAAAVVTGEGHTDCYAPAIGESNIIRAT